MQGDPQRPRQPQRPGQPHRGPEQGGPDDVVVAAEGIVVELIDSDGNVIDSVSTDANGNYAFDSVSESGSYQVRVAESDEWVVAGTDTWDLSISNGDEEMDGVDFRVLV